MEQSSVKTRNAITESSPDPHFIPGYTGHCPCAKEYYGKSYGAMTYDLLVNRCTYHSPKYILTEVRAKKPVYSDPNPETLRILEEREHQRDVKYRHPILIGYGGHLPKYYTIVGKRFLAAAEDGVIALNARVHSDNCHRRTLAHRDVLNAGLGVFRTKTHERYITSAKYRPPLMETTPTSATIKLDPKPPCDGKRQIVDTGYARETPIPYLDNRDVQKYLMTGYAGHVPMASSRFGLTQAILNKFALRDFIHLRDRMRGLEPCPKCDGALFNACEPFHNPCASDYMASFKQDFLVYPKTGVMSSYGGHVPGLNYSLGETYNKASRKARTHLGECKFNLYY
ncbi:UPF0605 protein CG18335-like [Teleopsis dalmanni]|uniref:UPF0605 protein CG18335-like n=1 Tax=Teleopsis dalmanni TaxID=139649 RepID=UPI0018CF5A2C|nr:UPF0605 protein CG18335-like [Teleopsis dalmanni]XP_037959797.1 UPF0605 protein CG18335-like [Teleopsis dalmanni]